MRIRWWQYPMAGLAGPVLWLVLLFWDEIFGETNPEEDEG